MANRQSSFVDDCFCGRWQFLSRCELFIIISRSHSLFFIFWRLCITISFRFWSHCAVCCQLFIAHVVQRFNSSLLVCNGVAIMTIAVPFQANKPELKRLGPNYREVWEKTFWMEVYVPFKRKEIDSHQECSLKHPHLLPLPFSLY